MTDVVSRPKTQPGMAVTHKLGSRGRASSAGLKRGQERQSLTFWRAEDRRRQEA